MKYFLCALLLLGCRSGQRDDLPNKLVVKWRETSSGPHLFIDELIVEKEYIFAKGSIFNEILWEKASLKWEVEDWEANPPRLEGTGLKRWSIPIPDGFPEPKKVTITFTIAGKKVTLVSKVVKDDPPPPRRQSD